MRHIKGAVPILQRFLRKYGWMYRTLNAAGAGKTTIVRLLSRSFQPHKGEILLDRVPLSGWNLTAEAGGLEAEVSEQGLDFSTGQRQLLSFARAYQRETVSFETASRSL